MEIVEVLAPQFVVPVAAVVLCALLVFMFGFKHAPEPTFEYDSVEERKVKKTKGKKKPERERSTSSNGHVVNIEPPKTSTTILKQAVQEKKDVTSKPKKKVAKVIKPEVVVATPLEKDAGGWTTAVSKKEKKKKRSDQDDFPQNGSKEDYATSNSEVEEEPISVLKSVVNPVDRPSPIVQRSSKKAKKSKSITNKENNTTEIEKIAEPVKEVKVSEELKPEISNANDEGNNIVRQIIDDKQPTLKKNKKKKKKSESDAGNIEESSTTIETREEIQEKVQQQGQQKVVQVENTIENQIAEAMRESPSLTPTETKPVKSEGKSPKKNKKKQKGTSRQEPHPESGPNTSQITDTSPKIVDEVKINAGATNVKQSEKSATLSHSKDFLDGKALQVTKSEPAAVVSATNTAEVTNTEVVNAASGDTKPTAGVTFDELGDWQEAKVVKKKKKPRRDN